MQKLCWEESSRWSDTLPFFIHLPSFFFFLYFLFSLNCFSDASLYLTAFASIPFFFSSSGRFTNPISLISSVYHRQTLSLPSWLFASYLVRFDRCLIFTTCVLFTSMLMILRICFVIADRTVFFRFLWFDSVVFPNQVTIVIKSIERYLDSLFPSSDWSNEAIMRWLFRSKTNWKAILL